MKKCFALCAILIVTALTVTSCSLLPGFLNPQNPTEPAPTVAPAPTEPAPTVAPATEAPTEAPTEPPIGTLSDYVKTGQELNVGAVTFRLPEILLDSADASAANAEIMDTYGEVIEKGSNGTGANTLDYEAYLNDKVLSVVISSRYDGGNTYGLCYVFDVMTGDRLDSEALCNLLGKSYSDALDALYDNLVDYYEDKWSELPGNDSEKEKTYSYSNLKASTFYLDGSGKLTAMIDTYAAVGGGHWIAQIAAE